MQNSTLFSKSTFHSCYNFKKKSALQGRISQHECYTGVWSPGIIVDSASFAYNPNRYDMCLAEADIISP